jgi:phytoene desaturase
MARPLDVRCGARVTRIERSGGRVTGVALEDRDAIAVDAVVCNGDVLRTHELLGRRAPRRRLRETMSCFLLYLGTDRPFERLLHHTLLVGEGYREFIRAVTRGRELPGNFSTYVHAPSRTEAAMAAPGGDSLAVLLPVPNLRAGIDWEAEGDRLRDALLADFEASFGLGGLREAVVVEHRMTPMDFASDLGALWGNAFSLEPTLHQSAYFRHPNRDRTVAGLYFAGAGTHPGAGVPGVLLGAEVTAGLVAADRGFARREEVPA